MIDKNRKAPTRSSRLDYGKWFDSLKRRYRASQVKAAVKVNGELLGFYWTLGREIVVKKAEELWGSGIVERLSADFKKEFPTQQGFSTTNLWYMKKWYVFYASSRKFLHQPGGEMPSGFANVPWRHHVEIFTHAQSVNEALFYVAKTAENGWSRNVLMNMMESDLYHAKGRAVTNFAVQLPDAASDLAQQTLKDPYCFDFLAMRERYTERELEDALVDNIAKFLLELGSGFSFVGRQWRMEVDDEEFFIDLLFYHLKLRRYVVIELKTGPFKPEYVGKLGFYVQTVNAQLKHPTDEDAIGLLICKRKNRLVAEYSLKSSSQLLGVSEYKLTRLLPAAFKPSLPSIKEIETRLHGKP